MRTPTHELLIAKYGPLMDAKALCEVFKYPSVPALKRSVDRGRMPCPVFTFPGRRGLFAKTEEVAHALDKPYQSVHSFARPEEPAPDRREG